MKIGFFNYEYTGKRFGGNVYDSMAAAALASEHDVVTSDVVPWVKRTGKWPQQLALTRWVETRSDRDLWVRGPMAVAAMGRRARGAVNVALVHHIDDSAAAGHNRWLRRPVTPMFLRRARACDAAVVVARYWTQYLEERGVRDVRVIHNAFDVEAFRFTPGELRAFREGHGLLGRPVVYVGNPQRAKGAVEVCAALAGMDVHLVTSGIQDVELPATVFRLDYADYRRLLAVSDVVVTMSSFLEGWNRVAHEAMLCRTPVVGSGTGGMEELLTDGGQIVCRDLAELRGRVEFAIEHADSLGEAGYTYARQFTRERFARQWLGLIAELAA